MAAHTPRAPRRKSAAAKTRPRAAARGGGPAAAKPLRARRGAAPPPADPVAQALALFAHEVRTPLTGIRAMVDLLATSELGSRERHWVDTIRASADHLSALATLFVDAARRDGGRLVLREDPFDLGALARAAAGSLAGRAAAKGLRVETRIADGLPAQVTGDAVRLRAALENLIDNAVKFTEQGRVGLRVAATRRPGGRVKVSFAVSDSGIGLSLAEIRRLFRPFSQANAGIAARFGGAGLGLASVRAIARAMGGDVTVTARRGGTLFTFTAVLAAVGLPAAASASPSPVGAARAGLRLLSVEDNPFGRVVLNAILTELGHHTEFIGLGAAAPARLRAARVDAVLMDMVLPDIGGVEAIRRIRALRGPMRRVPVIGVSGRAEDEAAARKAGADAFLLKPVSPRLLAQTLAAVTRPEAAAT